MIVTAVRYCSYKSWKMLLSANPGNLFIWFVTDVPRIQQHLGLGDGKKRLPRNER